MVRHDLGLSKKESRFPGKDTCLAIYSFAINSGGSIKTTLRDKFPWAIEWKADLRKLFGQYVAAKQRQNVLDYDDLLLAWAEMMNDADLAAELGSRGYRRRRGSRIAAMEPCEELIDRSAKLGHASLSDH